MTAPPDGTPIPARLNRDQARLITSVVWYVEQLLRDIERLARLQPSPFNRERSDLTSMEADLVVAFVETARDRLLSMLDHLHLARPRATQSARWAITTALRFIDSSLSEISMSSLRGYGEIDGTSGDEATAVAATLRTLVARGLDLLQPRDGAQLRERLARVAGPAGEVLRRAEAFSTARGLIEVRPLIAAAADRVEASTVDVGVFGRVSAGKSSLINALVRAPLLPVGATPVTAVPLRVVRGPPQVRVFLVDGREEVISPDRLHEFATESGNRDNARGVRSILVQTPDLGEGLALIDTPGVGSMSMSGPAQAFAWLPRCDLGLVLIAAGTPVGRDELALVTGLTQAGIAVEILVSKADLLSYDERQSALDYVRSEIEQSTSITEVAAWLVSVDPSERDLLEHWRREELIPLVVSRKRTAAAALARRLRALLEALNVAMQRQPALDRAAIDAQHVRLAASRSIDAIVNELQESAKTALALAASEAVVAWRARVDARAAVRHALLDAPSDALAQARAVADSVFSQHDHASGEDAGRRLPPLFDPPFLDALPVAAQPRAVDRLFAPSAARRQLASLEAPLAEAYGVYANRLRAWAMARLAENVERATAMGLGSNGPMSPELRSLAALVEEHFPERGA